MAEAFALLTDRRLLAAGGELFELALQKINGTYAFNLTDPKAVLTASPSLVSYLAEKNLLNNLIYVGMPHCPASSVGQIHVDGKCAEAINFPVLNCADSDYVWFDAKVKDTHFRQATLGHTATSGIAEYRLCDADTAKEITRVSCAQPVWFNTHIPHCGVNRSLSSRVVATLRFNVKLDTNDL